jgi:hypothetical protein
MGVSMLLRMSCVDEHGTREGILRGGVNQLEGLFVFRIFIDENLEKGSELALFEKGMRDVP